MDHTVVPDPSDSSDPSVPSEARLEMECGDGERRQSARVMWMPPFSLSS